MDGFDKCIGIGADKRAQQQGAGGEQQGGSHLRTDSGNSGLGGRDRRQGWRHAQWIPDSTPFTSNGDFASFNGLISKIDHRAWSFGHALLFAMSPTPMQIVDWPLNTRSWFTGLAMRQMPRILKATSDIRSENFGIMWLRESFPSKKQSPHLLSTKDATCLAIGCYSFN